MPRLLLGKSDKIHYTMHPSGEVVETRAEAAEAAEAADPVPETFLGFLARDMIKHPEHIRSLDAELVQRMQSLVGGIDVDLDAELSADDG